MFGLFYRNLSPFPLLIRKNLDHKRSLEALKLTAPALAIFPALNLGFLHLLCLMYIPFVLGPRPVVWPAHGIVYIEENYRRSTPYGVAWNTDLNTYRFSRQSVNTTLRPHGARGIGWRLVPQKSVFYNKRETIIKVHYYIVMLRSLFN